MRALCMMSDQEVNLTRVVARPATQCGGRRAYKSRQYDRPQVQETNHQQRFKSQPGGEQRYDSPLEKLRGYLQMRH